MVLSFLFLLGDYGKGSLRKWMLVLYVSGKGFSNLNKYVWGISFIADQILQYF